MLRSRFQFFTRGVLFIFIALLVVVPTYGSERKASKYFERVRNDPLLLRVFLAAFPKGGDIHSHLSGAVYAESYLKWAARDGKCVDLAENRITPPPCDAAEQRPSVKAIKHNSDLINPLIDAFSMRNFQRRDMSGHNQFFATFSRFSESENGRVGDMLAEVSARAGRQNIAYLELMQSLGMPEAMQLARQRAGLFNLNNIEALINSREINQLVRETIASVDAIERQQRRVLGCHKNPNADGCQVKVRYLAQVIRTFPREQVFAQTLLAFKLVQQDPRYVGLNFVAPEDHPITLKDYRWQMETVGGLANHFPGAAKGITLHAGELDIGLVPPEDLRNHIRQAVDVAGARRIGHGVAVVYEDNPLALLRTMAEQEILVEINLTSNAAILGVSGDRHPFQTYRDFKVPVTLSTDDEGVSRIDLTHEYQRAVETYPLSYRDLKAFSRNALAYSFLPGDNLFSDVAKGKRVKACARDKPRKKVLSDSCQLFLDGSEKAHLQWQLEKQFVVFERDYD